MAVLEEYAARQILAVFARYNVAAAGVLRRHQFFEVRDSEFQRGIDSAVARGWIERHHYDRYRYVLTKDGREAFKTALSPISTPMLAQNVAPERVGENMASNDSELELVLVS
jgi:hypothetical protein